MKPISIQLYTVREMAAKDFIGTLRKIAEIGYAGVELSDFHGHAETEIKKVLDDLGLKASSSHDALPKDRAAFDATVAKAKLFGHDLTAIGWMPPEHFQSLERGPQAGRPARSVRPASKALRSEAGLPQPRARDGPSGR